MWSVFFSLCSADIEHMSHVINLKTMSDTESFRYVIAWPPSISFYQLRMTLCNLWLFFYGLISCSQHLLFLIHCEVVIQSDVVIQCDTLFLNPDY